MGVKRQFQTEGTQGTEMQRVETGFAEEMSVKFSWH